MMEIDQDGDLLYVQTAKNKNDFEEIWSTYSFKSESPSVNFKQDMVFFIGITESGSCPNSIHNMEMIPKDHDLMIYLQSSRGGCTMDATPRLFVIKASKEQSMDLKTIKLSNRYTKLIIPIK